MNYVVDYIHVGLEKYITSTLMAEMVEKLTIYMGYDIINLV